LPTLRRPARTIRSKDAGMGQVFPKRKPTGWEMLTKTKTALDGGGI
jgi:hypothetical protein